jgi:16S rRNA (guanine527-N7)-methyltransferase
MEGLEQLGAWMAEQGLPCSTEMLDQLHAFVTDLYSLNETRNLTRVPKEEFWLRHVVDSLLVHSLLPEGATVLDIGTGPGFPAWPLAWARHDLRITALDSSNKMLGFLARHGLPNLKAVLGRAEEWGVRERFDLVTGRAVAPLAIQLELSAAPCQVGGVVIPMRSANDQHEIQAKDFSVLGLALEKVERRTLPDVGAERLFPAYRKVAKTPREYPRKWADIRRKPL